MNIVFVALVERGQRTVLFLFLQGITKNGNVESLLRKSSSSSQLLPCLFEQLTSISTRSVQVRIVCQLASQSRFSLQQITSADHLNRKVLRNLSVWKRNLHSLEIKLHVVQPTKTCIVQKEYLFPEEMGVGNSKYVYSKKIQNFQKSIHLSL